MSEKTNKNLIPLNLVDVHIVSDCSRLKYLEPCTGDVAHSQTSKLNRPLSYVYDDKWKILFHGDSVKYYKLVFIDINTGKKIKHFYPANWEAEHNEDVIDFAEKIIESQKRNNGKTLRLAKLKLYEKRTLLN